MWRSLALLLGGLAALASAGCRQDGSLQVSWSFVGPQSAADGCGQHGVDSVLVTSVDTGSDSDQVQAICTLGVVTRPVPAGTWTVSVQALDPQGNSILVGSLGPSPVDFVVADDGPPVPVSATFAPLPACSDGVDNDGDGRVDLDDPDCLQDPMGTHE
jgi:hypothetical protein